MTIFMLHFGCQSSNNLMAPQKTADSCAICDDLQQAESVARAAIHHHGYTANDLIAYSRLEENRIATLNDHEATLYLKALKRKPRVAVIFS